MDSSLNLTDCSSLNASSLANLSSLHSSEEFDTDEELDEFLFKPSPGKQPSEEEEEEDNGLDAPSVPTRNSHLLVPGARLNMSGAMSANTSLNLSVVSATNSILRSCSTESPINSEDLNLLAAAEDAGDRDDLNHSAASEQAGEADRSVTSLSPVSLNSSAAHSQVFATPVRVNAGAAAANGTPAEDAARATVPPSEDAPSNAHNESCASDVSLNSSAELRAQMRALGITVASPSPSSPSPAPQPSIAPTIRISANCSVASGVMDSPADTQRESSAAVSRALTGDTAMDCAILREKLKELEGMQRRLSDGVNSIIVRRASASPEPEEPVVEEKEAEGNESQEVDEKEEGGVEEDEMVEEAAVEQEESTAPEDFAPQEEESAAHDREEENEKDQSEQAAADSEDLHSADADESEDEEEDEEDEEDDEEAFDNADEFG